MVRPHARALPARARAHARRRDRLLVGRRRRRDHRRHLDRPRLRRAVGGAPGVDGRGAHHHRAAGLLLLVPAVDPRSAPPRLRRCTCSQRGCCTRWPWASCASGSACSSPASPAGRLPGLLLLPAGCAALLAYARVATVNPTSAPAGARAAARPRRSPGLVLSVARLRTLRPDPLRRGRRRRAVRRLRRAGPRVRDADVRRLPRAARTRRISSRSRGCSPTTGPMGGPAAGLDAVVDDGYIASRYPIGSAGRARDHRAARRPRPRLALPAVSHLPRRRDRARARVARCPAAAPALADRARRVRRRAAGARLRLRDAGVDQGARRDRDDRRARRDARRGDPRGPPGALAAADRRRRGGRARRARAGGAAVPRDPRARRRSASGGRGSCAAASAPTCSGSASARRPPSSSRCRCSRTLGTAITVTKATLVTDTDLGNLAHPLEPRPGRSGRGSPATTATTRRTTSSPTTRCCGSSGSRPRAVSPGSLGAARLGAAAAGRDARARVAVAARPRRPVRRREGPHDPVARRPAAGADRRGEPLARAAADRERRALRRARGGACCGPTRSPTTTSRSRPTTATPSCWSSTTASPARARRCSTSTTSSASTSCAIRRASRSPSR